MYYRLYETTIPQPHLIRGITLSRAHKVNRTFSESEGCRIPDPKCPWDAHLSLLRGVREGKERLSIVHGTQV